jgi:Chromo (CHRromatin Organisation MOdifier) domain
LVESGKEFEVEQIVDMRVVKGQKQFLVKWKDYGDFDNTWVAESELGNAREAIS